MAEASAPDPDPPPSVGEASMTDDGTILLHLRAEAANAVGDAVLRYAPDHPQYQQILDHLSGLHPGESKPVPPFP